MFGLALHLSASAMRYYVLFISLAGGAYLDEVEKPYPLRIPLNGTWWWRSTRASTDPNPIYVETVGEDGA